MEKNVDFAMAPIGHHKCLGYTMFRNIWTEHFQHVLTPKVCFN